MLLPRNLIRAVPFATQLNFTQSPIQLGLQRSPWHVAVCSMMLCRVARRADIIAEVFARWPTPALMEASDAELEFAVQPLGMHRQRARYMQQLSRKWFTDTWEDLRELPGVGKYVACAVELFCFNNPEHTDCDRVLFHYAQIRPTSPMLWEAGPNRWFVDRDEYMYAEDAYSVYARKLAAST